MPLELTASQTDYIILTQNKIMSANEGVKIFIKTGVVTPQKREQLYSRLYNSPNYTNNIILSYKFSTSVTCLLTLNNIKNNIKFLFTDSTNKKNGKIIFIKNKIVDNYKLNSNYLIFATDNEFNNIGENKFTLAFHLNYYFNNIKISNNNFYNIIGTTNYNYDYYKLNVKDYILRDYSYNFFVSSVNNDICYNKLNFKINAISEDYSSNLYIDVCSNNFNRLSDISNISRLVKYNNNTTPYPIYNNIYNKYYVCNKNIRYDVILTCSGNTLTISFDTFLIKTNNFAIAKDAQSKILFDTNNTIYFLNVQVSTPSKPIVEKLTEPHIVYLSLGNFRTGLVQSDIYNHIALTPNMEKVYFKENITANVIKNPINVAKKYSTLIPYLANHYLYDIELSANILLKSVTINTIYTSINKIFTVNFGNFFDLSNLRNYYNTFNNLAFTTISNGNSIIKPVVNYFDSSNNYNINSISFDIVSVTSNNLYTRNSTALTLLNSYYNLIKPALLDVRFNYDSYFYTNFTFNVLYNYPTKYEIINTYAINFGCLIYTTPARDFTDVECIYIYHNPETDPNPLYRYPYNNIEIIRDPSNIDTLAKAIELLPGASSSTSNSIIIPEKNGSNLSRKMIQGLIGLNNVPKLLSIKPYDENVIVGRGFVNQYQIDNTCITTTEDIIKNKINANKHSSAKDSRTFTTNKLEKQNFANLVRSNRRNRLSQQCIEDLREDIRNNTPLATQVNYANIVPYTPRFKIFKTGQGHYL